MSYAAWQEIRVGMTKGRVALSVESGLRVKELQIPPLRCAPVGMTKGRFRLTNGCCIGMCKFRSETGAHGKDKAGPSYLITNH
jgi:hypothetical protein